AEDGIRDSSVTGVRRVLFRSLERVLAPEARRIVAAPHTDVPEAEARIQRLGRGIARPHFEEQAPRAAPARELERLAQQGAAVAAALVARGDREVEQMRLARR